MQDPRYKHEYLDNGQRVEEIAEDDESYKRLEARDCRYSCLTHLNISNFPFKRIIMVCQCYINSCHISYYKKHIC